MQSMESTVRARTLRRDQTLAETRLWEVLRHRKLGGWKWKRQVPRGPYIVDFLCVERLLVVELDGGQHADAQAYDERRTAYLRNLGFRVLRFWNHAVIEGREGVCDAISPPVAARPSPSLSRLRERNLV